MDEINFGKIRKADLSKWNEKAKKIKLDKTDVYIIKPDDFVPENSEKLGFIHFAKKREEQRQDGHYRVGQVRQVLSRQVLNQR